MSLSLAAISYLYQPALRRGVIITLFPSIGVLWIVVLSAPIVAVGTLFGNTKRGMIIAFVVVFCCLVFVAIPPLFHH